MRVSTGLIGAAAAAALWLAAGAASAASSLPLLRESEVQSFTVNPDGSFVEVTELVILINDDSAVAGAAQQAVQYNNANSTLEVLSAYTLKPDGRKLAVDAGSVKDQQAASSVNAPQYLDLRDKHIIFPHVAAGDRLVYSTRLTRGRPLFAGQFSDVTGPGYRAVGKLTVSYDMPAAMELHADNRGFVQSEPAAPAGRRRYRWDYLALGKPPRAEADAVSSFDHGARVFVTTFADNAALARAYEAATRAATGVTPPLAQLATLLTAQRNGDRDKAIALATWVRNSIRPLDLKIASANALAPHSAAEVIANRFGDSRDQVVLLRALLDAAGIGNSAALLNAGNAYRLPEVAAIDLLERAIVYVPGVDLYLDPTDRATAPGFLAEALLDKPVLLTATATMARTPPSQHAEIFVNSDFEVAADGAADFHSITLMRGAYAENQRAANRGVTEAMRATWVETILRIQGQVGSGAWDTGDTSVSTPEYQMRYSGHSEDLAALPGPIGIRAGSSLNPLLAAAVATLARESDRRLDFVCAGQDIEEQARYKFAGKVRIIALPKPVALHDPYIDYTASYEHKDNEVWVRRHYKLHHPGRVCDGADFRNLLPSIALMQRDLNSQLIIQAK